MLLTRASQETQVSPGGRSLAQIVQQKHLVTQNLMCEAQNVSLLQTLGMNNKPP